MSNRKQALKAVRVAPGAVSSKAAAGTKNIPTVVPPRALAQSQLVGRVRLELEAPQAREVFVAGSFNGWQPAATALQSSGAGKWARELTLASGQYEYLFLVDGQWLPDPKARDYTPNPFGGLNCLLTIP